MKNSLLDLNRVPPASAVVSLDAWAQNDEPQQVSPERAETLLPRPERWPELLGFDGAGAVEEILSRALIDPVQELNTARGKRIRGQLVALSFRLVNGDQPSSPFSSKRCHLAAEAVEFIHAGSLIVDDIEDGSEVRRGRPALHLRYPMPIALNAGNWLYFWPFDLFREMGLPPGQLLLVHDFCHRTLLRAHFGQALDLGARIDRLAQASVADVCLASMRLKTGALMGFAAFIGGVIAASSNRLLPVLDDFGRDLGVALQMFDDLGNALGKCEPAKRYEDLVLARPSWVWACAAQHSIPSEYRRFLAAVGRLPDAAELEAWLEDRAILVRTRDTARSYLDACFDALARRLSGSGVRWSRRAFNELRQLGEEIAVAYG